MVFTHADGSHLNQWFVYRTFQRYLAKAELPHHRMHDLRHPDVKQATKNNEYLIEFLKIMRIDTLLQITLSSAFISESILEGGFDFYPVIMKNMNFADSALR